MKQILFGFLCWTCCVFGVGIPREENLSISSLDNGIEVWLKQYALPRQTISCRVIAKSPLEPVPQIFSLDCPIDAFEGELPYFADHCRESIPNDAQYKIGVVVVGDFEGSDLGEFIASAFEVFPKRTAASSAPPISLDSSADMVYLSLSYPTSFQEIKTDQDLKKLWVLYLLQSVIEERFRKVVKSVNGEWVQPEHVKYLLPYSHTSGRGKQALNHEPLSMLLACLAAMKEVKSTGFSEQELSDAKAKLQKNLLNFDQRNPTSTTLADYLASHSAFGAGHPEYSIFMTMSFKAISEIQRDDVAKLLGAYFNDATRCVVMSVPPRTDITEASIQKTLDSVKTDDLVLNLNGDNNNGDGKSVYSQLPITEAEAQTIYQIIDALGSNGLLKLYKEETKLEELGLKVQSVHPFKFLEVVFTNPHLKECMVIAEDSYFKWHGFMTGSGKTAGFIAKCEREYARNNFAPYIVGFCQAVKAHPDQIRSLVEKREWEKLVRCLIKLEN